VEGSYEFGIEPSGSIKCWETLESHRGTRIGCWWEFRHLPTVQASMGIAVREKT
jgi:hypothetical protein